MWQNDRNDKNDKMTLGCDRNSKMTKLPQDVIEMTKKDKITSGCDKNDLMIWQKWQAWPQKWQNSKRKWQK